MVAKIDKTRDYPLIRKLRELRYPYYAIGNLLGVTANRIYEICRDQGWRPDDLIHAEVLEELNINGR